MRAIASRARGEEDPHIGICIPPTGLRRTASALIALAALVVLGALGPALARATAPAPATTTGSVTAAADGSHTVTIQGRWIWPSEDGDCNLHKHAAGFAIDWGDGNGNHVTTVNGLSVDVGVGTATVFDAFDNSVHPTPATEIANPGFGGCGTVDPATGHPAGDWGPITHTYAPGIGAAHACPVLYDVHLLSPGGLPRSARETTAGGADHNEDNSAEPEDDADDETPEPGVSTFGTGCFDATFAPAAQAPAPLVQLIPPLVVPGPQPVLGKTVVVSAVKKGVKVRSRGSRHFVQLQGTQSIPVNSTIDATRGQLQLVSSTGTDGGTQSARFYGGQFVVGQKAASKAITDVTLTGAITGCPVAFTGRYASSARTRSRAVWGNGHGRYRTHGRYASASARGTFWFTEDTCTGTLVRVRRSTVAVRDFVKHKTVLVHAGESYFAAAPGTRRPDVP